MVPESVKKIGKKVVDYPEHGVEVISVKDWSSSFRTNPLPHVAPFSVFVSLC